MSKPDAPADAPLANLDERGVRRRLIGGIAGITAAAALAMALLATGRPRHVRLAVFPFAFFGALGVLQARAKT